MNRERDLVTGKDDAHDLLVSVECPPGLGTLAEPAREVVRRRRRKQLLRNAVVVNLRTKTANRVLQVQLDRRTDVVEREVEDGRRFRRSRSRRAL
jgi:hypothetical protein